MHVILKNNKKKGYIILTAYLMCILMIVVMIFCIDLSYSSEKVLDAEKQNAEMEQLLKYVQKTGIYKIKKWTDYNNILPENSDLQSMNFNFNEGRFNCSISYSEDTNNYIVQTDVCSNAERTKKTAKVLIDKNYFLKYQLLLNAIKNYSVSIIGDSTANSETCIKDLESDGSIYIQNKSVGMDENLKIKGNLIIKGDSLNIHCIYSNINVSGGIYADINDRIINNNNNFKLSIIRCSLKNVPEPSIKTGGDIILDQSDSDIVKFIIPDACSLNDFCKKYPVLNSSEAVKLIYVNGDISIENLTLNNVIIISNGSVKLSGENNLNNSCIVCSNIKIDGCTKISKLSNLDSVKEKLINFFRENMNVYNNIDDGITGMYNESL